MARPAPLHEVVSYVRNGEEPHAELHVKGAGHLGLDVHAATIAVAIAEGRGEVRSLGQIPNRPDAVLKLLKKLGDLRTLHACYEAGPTGYVLYWQLTKLGVRCEGLTDTPYAACNSYSLPLHTHQNQLRRRAPRVRAAVRDVASKRSCCCNGSVRKSASHGVPAS